MALTAGMGRGASAGVLFRDATALESLCRADVLVIDKTGTLTEGKPRLQKVEGGDEVLRLAASLEQASEHPLAAAVVQAARERGLNLSKVEHFEAFPGKGVTGTVEGHAVIVGTAALLREKGVTVQGEEHIGLQVAVDGKLAGVLEVTDTIRATTAEAIRLLRDDGMRIVMLTGDRKATAEAVARQVNIDEVIAEVLPVQKADMVRKLRSEGHVVAMAGDGINDAPALASADVGIALGTGTDVAMESAAVTLVHGDLRAIARARRLSRATVAAIRQNLWLAFAYNILSIPLAASVLDPHMPILASAAMSLSSLSVVGNSLRLRRTQL